MMRKVNRYLGITGLILLLASSSMSLAGPEQESHGESAGHGEEHRHHLSLFLGNTHDEGEDEFTVGLE